MSGGQPLPVQRELGAQLAHLAGHASLPARILDLRQHLGDEACHLPHLGLALLATGEKEWTDPRGGAKKTGVPLYSNTICHRIIPNFMIQCGDPTGTGRGDPGYRFEDEFQSGRKFDKVGLLAMANAGPGTNGSQFFVTVSTPNYLNNKHTIFGEVVKGVELVAKIARAGNAKVRLEKLTITRGAMP